MPEPDPAVAARNDLFRRFLAAFWVVWGIWLIARPSAPLGSSSISAEGRKELAILAFAVVFFIAYGLLRTWRWPVTASRALVAALIAGVIIGPAGREVWVYLVDVVFALAGFVPAFIIIKMGTTPPPKRTSEIVTRRMERKREQLRRGRPRK